MKLKENRLEIADGSLKDCNNTPKSKLNVNLKGTKCTKKKRQDEFNLKLIDLNE